MHPHLFQFGRLVLPTYGFLVALGTILSLLVCLRSARLLSLDTDKIWSMALVAIVTGLVGSRILVILLNWPRYGVRALSMSLNGSRGPGLTAIAIAVVTGVLYALHLGLPLRRTADAIAPSLALGSSVISIGCLEAGCDYGTPTHLPWAVVFTNPAATPGTPLGVPLHPTQIYASLVEFALFVLLLWLLHRPHNDGEILGAWLFLGGLSSFLLTYLRGDGGWSLFGLITLTQLVAAAMVLAGGLLWLHRPQATQVSHGMKSAGCASSLFPTRPTDSVWISFSPSNWIDVSRSRVQLLLEQGSVLIGGKLAKASRKVRSGESISILGDPQPPPLRAIAEAIPLEIVYEDSDLAVVNKPAGMMVHAGSGATEDARNRGTLVNALLHHMRELSSSSGPLRPGIVHRLDKQTSGLIVVAKNDLAHARLSSMFSRRQVTKTLPHPGARRVAAGEWNGECPYQPRRRPPDAHDHASRRRPHRRLSLAGAAAHSRSLRQLHPGLRAY